MVITLPEIHGSLSLVERALGYDAKTNLQTGETLETPQRITIAEELGILRVMVGQIGAAFVHQQQQPVQVPPELANILRGGQG